ncbi:MAG: efflux RND transporter periplasmic adaptor subunit [Bacteroidetes bacterium]|nr:efflux RND transporter periplasmic adaptor subunit [Bacteroidota bacterium]
MRTLKIFIPCVLFLISCGNNNEKVSVAEEGVNVTVFQAERRYHREVFEYSATLKPFREANLGATIPGKVEKIRIPKGNFVKEGEIVVEMSAEVLLMAQIEKDAIEKDYNRVARLKEKGSVTQQDYDHVLAKYEASKSKVELFENNTRIRAPFSGIIADYLVKEGENFMFSPGFDIGLSHTSGIVRLVQVNPLIASFNVNEKDIRHFKKGMNAEIWLDAFPGEKFKSEIIQVGPLVSTLSRTAEVQIQLPNNDGKLMPGMYARVKVELPGDTLVFVPRHAVLESDLGFYVWVVKDKKAQKKIVVPLLTKHGYTAIENILEGENIVVAGINRLSEGIQINE